MDQFAQWMTSKGTWSCSEFSDLPVPGRNTDSASQHWTIIAGGLALILSRASAAELANRFAASLELYELLRERLRLRASVAARPELLGDVMHEIAHIADPMTKTALHARFQASLQKRTGPATQPPVGQRHTDSRMASSIQPQTSSSRRHSTRAAETDDADTVVNLDVFSERCSTLRRSIATARSTNFAELR